jgi:hypothetical protein
MQNIKKRMLSVSVVDPGCLTRIRIFHLGPGSRVKNNPDPGDPDPHQRT